MAKKFLHVGPGSSYKDNTTQVFNTDDWDEVRLDIDPNYNPDIVASITDMSVVEDNSYDAVYSAHNIEHVFAHEVIGTLKEFNRVLKDNGFLILTCPDIKGICKLIGEGNIAKKLYSSPAGDIYPLDILYGLRQAIAQGQHYMSHKHGFTGESLLDHVKLANFKSFCVAESSDSYALWLIAYKNSDKTMKELEIDLKAHLIKNG